MAVPPERYVLPDDALAKSVSAIQVVLLKEHMTRIKISEAMNALYAKKKRRESA